MNVNEGKYRDAVSTFMDKHVLPLETTLARADTIANEQLAELTLTAREQGLWGTFFPKEWGGCIQSLQDYLEVGYQEGRNEFAPTIFGGLATVDAYMLHRHGSPFIQQHFLKAMSCGEITSAYAMTEPDQPGSIPATISCSARRIGSHWKINGRKWFICNAIKADYVTTLVNTEPKAALSERLTMFVVPINMTGCIMEKSIPIFGRHLGQGEYRFSDLLLDDKYRLGEVGEGLAIMHNRVGLGRLLRALHWLGLADRCLELTYERIHSDRGQRSRLSDKQLIRQHIFDTHLAIENGKLLMAKAAKEYDENKLTNTTTNLTKLMASRALSRAADSAIQIYGAEGVSDMTALGSIAQVARTTRILDGADEALINSVGNELIKTHSYISQHQQNRFSVELA